MLGSAYSPTRSSFGGRSTPYKGFGISGDTRGDFQKQAAMQADPLGNSLAQKSDPHAFDQQRGGFARDFAPQQRGAGDNTMAFGALRGMFGMGGGRNRTPGGPQGAFGQQVFKQNPPMNQPTGQGGFGNAVNQASQMVGQMGMKPPMQGGMNQGGGFGRALQQGGQMNGPMGPKPPMQGGMQPIQQMPNKPPMGQGNPWGNWPGGRSPYEGGISENGPVAQPAVPRGSPYYQGGGYSNQVVPIQDQRMRISEQEMGQGGIGPSPNMQLPPELQQQRDQIDQIRNQFQSRGQVPY